MRLPRAPTPVTALIATTAQAPTCHRALAAARAYALSRGSSAARRRHIVHHRTSSSSGSIPHDRQRVLPPRLPCAALAGSRHETPVACARREGRSRSVTASIILPPSKISQPPFGCRTHCALDADHPKGMPQVEIPIETRWTVAAHLPAGSFSSGFPTPAHEAVARYVHGPASGTLRESEHMRSRHATNNVPLLGVSNYLKSGNGEARIHPDLRLWRVSVSSFAVAHLLREQGVGSSNSPRSDQYFQVLRAEPENGDFPKVSTR